QIDTSVGDVAGNVRAVLEWTARAAEQGAGLVAFPEMTLTGYPVEDLALRASFREAAHRAAARTAAELAARRLGGLTVVVGTMGPPRPVGPGRSLATNRAVVLRDGAVLATYDKHHLPTYGVFDEHRVFAPGDEPCSIDLGPHRVAGAVCEDIWADGAPYARAGRTDLLLGLNA